MRRLVLALTFAAAAFGSAQAQTDVRVTPLPGSGMATDDIQVIAQIRSAEANNDSGTYEPTMAMLAPVVHGEVYPRLSAAMKYRIDLAFGVAAFQLGIFDEAQHAFVRATTAFPGSDLKLWFIQLRAALRNNDFQEVYATFKAYRRLSLKEEIPLNDAQVHEIEQGLGTLPNAKDTQLEFES